MQGSRQDGAAVHNHLEAARLAERRPDLVDAAREWAFDCEWLDSDVIGALSGATILMSTEHHYAGGVAQLARDCALGQPEGTGR